MPYEIYPTPDSQLMDDTFHDWLEKCPNNWVRLDIEQGKEPGENIKCIAATYKFYRNDPNGGNDDD